jgi:hypothetical protein
MPGHVLHSGATVLCAHGGQAAPTVPSPRVKVGGQPVTTLSGPYTVTACPFTTPTGPLPCVTAQWTVGATRVRSGGAPLLLQDSQAVCAPNGTPVTITVTQLRVTAI